MSLTAAVSPETTHFWRTFGTYYGVSYVSRFKTITKDVAISSIRD